MKAPPPTDAQTKALPIPPSAPPATPTLAIKPTTIPLTADRTNKAFGTTSNTMCITAAATNPAAPTHNGQYSGSIKSLMGSPSFFDDGSVSLCLERGLARSAASAAGPADLHAVETDRPTQTAAVQTRRWAPKE